MKVFITGGCGFLGSHVCEYYKRKGEEVIAFDNLTKFEFSRSGYNTEEIRGFNRKYLEEIGVMCIAGDIRNREELNTAVTDCDYIVHTAAQPAMTIAIEEPELDLYSNVVGTFNVLDAARRYDIPVVTCSSIHVYGNGINDTLKEDKTRFVRTPPTIDETHPTLQGSVSPLHASKRAGEIYTQSFIDTYGVKAASFRLTGMYGPRQFGGEDHGWVANFVIRTLAGLSIKVFGTDKQVRDILFVSDAVSAFEAFHIHQKPGLYNIGGGMDTSISIGECLEKIKKISGMDQKIVMEPKRFGDLYYFVSDISKAKQDLKWSPRVIPDEGLEQLITWVKSNLHLFRGG